MESVIITGSDWDYINDHMGGHDEDGMPNFMNKRGFADDRPEPKKQARFKTFNEAKEWSISNSGKAFTRSPDGDGFIPKTT